MDYVDLSTVLKDALDATADAGKLLSSVQRDMSTSAEGVGVHFKAGSASTRDFSRATEDLMGSHVDLGKELKQITEKDLDKWEKKIDFTSEKYRRFAKYAPDWEAAMTGAHLRVGGSAEDLGVAVKGGLLDAATSQSQVLSSLMGYGGRLSGQYNRLHHSIKTVSNDLMLKSRALAQDSASTKISAEKSEELAKASEHAAEKSKKLMSSSGALAAQFTIATAALGGLALLMKSFSDSQQAIRDEFRESGLAIEAQDELYTQLRVNMAATGMSMEQSTALMGAAFRKFGGASADIARLTGDITKINVVMGLSADEAADFVYQVENIYRMGKGAGVAVAAGMAKAADVTNMTRQEAVHLLGTMRPLMERYFMGKDKTFQKNAVASMQAIAGAMKDVGGSAEELMGDFNKMFDITNAEGMRMRAMFSGAGVDISQALKEGNLEDIAGGMAKTLRKIPQEQYQAMKSVYSRMYSMSETQMDALRKLTEEDVALMKSRKVQILDAMMAAKPLEDEYQKALGTMNTEMAKLSKSAGGTFAFIGRAALLALVPLVKWLNKVFTHINGLILKFEQTNKHGKTIIKTIGLVTAGFIAFVGVCSSVAFIGLASKLSGITSALKGIGMTLQYALKPIEWAAQGIGWMAGSLSKANVMALLANVSMKSLFLSLIPFTIAFGLIKYGIENINKPIGALSIGLGIVAAGIGLVVAGFITLNIATGGIILLIGALVAGLIYVVTHWDKVKKVAISALSGLGDYLKDIWQSIKAFGQDIYKYLIEPFEKFFKGELGLFGLIGSLITGWGTLLGDFFGTIGAKLYYAIANVDWKSVWKSVTTVLEDLLIGAYLSIVKLFTGIGDALKKPLIATLDEIKLLLGALNPSSWFSSTPTGPGPTMPALNRPKIKPKGYAEGGVVTSPTLALIGERGPEAVLPLRQTSFGTSGHTGSPLDMSPVVAKLDLILKAIEYWGAESGSLPPGFDLNIRRV